MSEKQIPYKHLGNRLKYVREQNRQSLAEVSGAVEIDEEMLARIEAGEERPPEDVLLLLISYFEVQEREALQLWELANYGGEAPDMLRPNLDMPSNAKPTVMLLAIDIRTQYSDGLEVTANQAGLTLQFTQAGANGQVVPVARVGMSYEQGERVLQALQHAIVTGRSLNGQKLLPPPADSSGV